MGLRGYEDSDCDRLKEDFDRIVFGSHRLGITKLIGEVLGSRFGRQADVPLDQDVSRSLVVEAAKRSLDELENLADLVITGDVTAPALESLAIQCDDDLSCRLRLEAWRDDNLENVALMIESSGIIRAHVDLLDIGDLWDFCSDCRWLKESLRERLEAG